MTREEAIEILKDLWTYLQTDIRQALEMAIKTLEQESSGDLISLETVIEWLKAKDIIKLSSQEETARKELKALLPVNPQEPCNDVTIFKENALDAISRIGLLKSDTKEVQAVAECLRAVEALPPEPKAEKIIKMRDTTLEERESVDKYVKSISKPTGVDFWDLEQKPCDDAISRQAVLDIDFHRIIHTTAKPSEMIRQKVKALPSVNPQEPKTGHWIDRSEGGRIKYPWMESNECSKCGENGSAAWNYCPNCGARMVEPQESEE